MNVAREVGADQCERKLHDSFTIVFCSHPGVRAHIHRNLFVSPPSCGYHILGGWLALLHLPKATSPPTQIRNRRTSCRQSAPSFSTSWFRACLIPCETCSRRVTQVQRLLRHAQSAAGAISSLHSTQSIGWLWLSEVAWRAAQGQADTQRPGNSKQLA